MNESIRTEMSKILVKWDIPTRQAAISEIVSLIDEVKGESIRDFSDWIHFTKKLGGFNAEFVEEYLSQSQPEKEVKNETIKTRTA